MPYYLSLAFITIVGGVLFQKVLRTNGIPMDHISVVKVYRSLGRIALLCALLSFVALIVSAGMLLESYTFDVGWVALSFTQMLFWLFLYFAFVKPVLHDFRNVLERKR